MHAHRDDHPHYTLEDSEIIGQPEGGGECTKSEFADCDKPRQPRLNSRQYSSASNQCRKIQALLVQEMMKHPYTRTHWDKFASKVREVLVEIARDYTYDSMLPAEIEFLRWLIEEALPKRQLNFSEFARRHGIKRHQVTRIILPRVIRTYALNIDRAVFYFLLATKMTD